VRHRFQLGSRGLLPQDVTTSRNPGRALLLPPRVMRSTWAIAKNPLYISGAVLSLKHNATICNPRGQITGYSPLVGQTTQSDWYRAQVLLAPKSWPYSVVRMTIDLLCLTPQPCKLWYELVRAQRSFWLLVVYFYVSFDVPFGVPFDPAFSPGLEALWLSICITNRLHPKNLTNLFAVLIPYIFRDRTFYHFYLLHFYYRQR